MKCKRLLLLLLLAIGLPWVANAQESIPYTEGFENMSSASDLTDAGWISYQTHNGSFLAIETSESNVHSGSKALNIDSWAAGSSSDYVVVGLPTVNAAINTLQITFSYKVSTGTVYVGYLTDANDASTFVSLQSFSSSSSYTTKTVELNEAPASAARIAIKYLNWYRCYVDDITVETLPTCFAPQNLTCTEYTATSATLTWQRHANGTENAWVLQYSTDNTFATGVQSFNVSNTPSKELTGLTAETKYYARVRPDCDENLWSDVCEFKPSAVQTVTIGDGTSKGYYLPVNTYYNYSLAQQIYTAEEITAAGGSNGTINSISFYHAYTGVAKTMNGIQVYLLNTDKAAFANNTDMVPVTESDKVWEGNITLNGAGWVKIDFTTPFDYDGGNLIVCMYYPTKEYPGSSYVFSYTTTTYYSSVYYYSDSSNPDLNNINTYGGSKDYKQHHNNIQLGILPTNTPKPRNIQVSDITASQATVSWVAPATGTPTGYEYQIKVSGDEWPTSWTSAGNNLSVEPADLTASTDYVVRVRAVYAEGESGSIETEFRTLDACAFPTNFTATTVTGVGTDANFSWVKGYDETAWNLQLATDVDFNNVVTTYFTDDGFVVDGNNVTFHATTLTPEQTYYARVQADCGSGSTSVWSNVETFTPSNYVDFNFRDDATSSSYYAPFYYYTTYTTNQSQFVIPASELVDLTGGTIRSITYYTSSTATTDWGGVEFDVYMTEVQDNTFSSATFIDWATLGNPVYSGTVSLSNQKMIITFDNNYAYNGGNLLIGFKNKKAGTSTTSMSWTAYYGSTYYAVYQYGTNNATRSYYQPKITFNYQPTPYKKPVIDEANCTFGTTTAHIAWTVTGATPTRYQYQYKLTSETAWPTNWTSATTAAADLSGLTPGSFYDFRVKALYDGDNESVVVDYSFVTECAAITAFPWSENFEAYNAGDFSHPCWVNQHVSGEGTSIFQVYTSTNGSNTTHQLQLPDQTAGTETMLRLPEMNLPSNDYQFVIDVFRDANTYQSYPYQLEGIHVYVSTNGNLEGATELAYIPRHKDVSTTLIPAEEVVGWYTYEIPIDISGNCYIILKGVNQYCTSTYMDNLTVEQISTCARPSELAYSDVTNHSATIEWTAGDAEQALWQIAYSKNNFDPNTANFDETTVTTIYATAHPFTLDKILDAASTYYVYVRANCGTATEPDFGPWSRKGISFTTLAATPAPSNFVASNPASAKVDLVWNAGGGDFESWELYYVASETTPEAPTATTTATVSNITTLPTTEAPYVLERLNPVTKYYAWVRAKHVWDNETTYSDWVALTSSYFETLDACPTPTDLVATNLTSVSADLSWVGSDDVTEGYTVEYGEEGTYSLNETVDFSGLTTAEYTSEGVLPEGWMRYNSNPGYMPHVSDKSAYSYIDEFGTGNNYLLMTQNKSSNQYLYAIMPQISDLASLEFKYVYESTGTGVLSVGYVTDNTGYSTYQVLQTPTKSGTIATCKLTATDIATINANNGYVTFCYQGTSTTFYSVGIDDIVYKGGTYTPGATQTVQSEGTSITIDGLTPDKTYTVKVKSNCTNGEWSNMASFTTLAEGNMVFTNATNDGKWSTTGNWAPARLPVLTDVVILRANATIESGFVAEAMSINGTGTGTDAYTLTIKDGGKLKHLNSGVRATVEKAIRAYSTNYDADTYNNGDYYLIANPLTSAVTPSEANGFFAGNYDLYSWDYAQDLEWRNNVTSLMYGSYGYLYANEAGTTLTYTGTINAYTSYKYRTCDVASNPDGYNFPSWYLLGNPYLYDAYLANASSNGNALPYIKMNANGNGFENVAAGEPIPPMEGFFYQAVSGATSTYVVTTAPAVQSNSKLNMNLRRNNKQLDNAILVFGGDQQLGKMTFRPNSSKVFMPVEGKDYAITSVEGQVGEVPVSFVPENNGTYSLSFTSEEVTFSYLHLIDNMTGNDVNLLETPSYTFDARTTDYESRFRLVFATGSSATDDTFGFVNASGNFCIFGIEGEATVQVIDVLGHVLSSETFSGSYEKRINGAPGVYMVRLIQGNDVKVQKVVVR